MKVARLFLYPDLRRQVEGGRHGLLCPMVDLLRDSGFDVNLHGDSPDELALGRESYSVVRMIAPLGPLGVTFRRTYLEPFYHVETIAERWDWPVARACFNSDQPVQKAARFRQTQASRLFGNRPITRDGFVFVPLQGRLLDHRAFQSMTPLRMIETLLEHDPGAGSSPRCTPASSTTRLSWPRWTCWTGDFRGSPSAKPPLTGCWRLAITWRR